MKKLKILLIKGILFSFYKKNLNLIEFSIDGKKT